MTQHLLPDGTFTSSDFKYVKSWRALGDSLSRILDVKVISFDPGFLVQSNEGGSSVDIPTWLAIKIIQSQKVKK